MPDYTNEEEVQLKRVEIASVFMNTQGIRDYLDGPDELKDFKGTTIPLGYKKCGHCGRILKFYKFNLNNASSNKCTGNCKECQKDTSRKAYAINKDKVDPKVKYAENREGKLAAGRAYYQKNKEKVLSRQKEYHGTSKGRKVMKKSHTKRRFLMSKNAGIPWNREMVIDRDKMGTEFPECILCGRNILHEREIHMEHLLPVVMGGNDCFTNVACAHEICNLQKPKDAHTVSVEQVEKLIERAESYMEAHQDLFPAVFKPTLLS